MTDQFPILKISQLTKIFGDTTILNDINFSLNKGEIIILIGPSGGGKSTLLQCINCLTIPNKGSIALEGKTVSFTSKNDLLHLRQQVGMIFQDFNLFDHLTALKNITVPLRKVKKLSPKEAELRAKKELEQVGLADKCDLYPAQLSGGQKQRVAIARALAMDPKVLLLDEPTSALDPELTGEVITVIKELAANGMTMIMATHQMSLIATLADHILFMENGQIAESGSPDELLHQKQQSKTRGFCDRLTDFSAEE